MSLKARVVDTTKEIKSPLSNIRVVKKTSITKL